MNPDPIITNGLKLLAVLALVLLNGFFVAAELALVRIRETQLESLVVKGHRRARLAKRLINNLDAVISATQLGITLASLGLGALVEPMFMSLLAPVFGWLHIASVRWQHTIAFVVGFFINSFVLIVLGELTPKAVAIRF